MLSFLTKQGFSVVRIRGSHHALEKDEWRTIVPLHGNELLKIGTLRGILKDVNISPDEFIKLWKNS